MRTNLVKTVALPALLLASVALVGCGNKAPDPMGTVSGTIAYPTHARELSPDAVAYVRLADVTKGVVKGETVEQAAIPTDGKSELSFELPYNETHIDPDRDYAVDVRVVDRGELVYMSRGGKPVITKGNPHDAEVQVKQMRGL